MATQLFQAGLLKKQIEAKTAEIDAAYDTYKKYFLNEKNHEIIRHHNEEEYKPEFINKLFVEVLGYTRSFDTAEDDYNLRIEQKNEDDQKKADASIIVDGNVKAVIEIKDTRTIDLKRIQEQAFGYKNHHKNALYVITSNFEKLRFYIDYAGEYLEWNLFTLNRESFGSLWICLAWNNIKFDLPKKLKTQSIAREEEITRDFYNHYQQFKDDLYANLIEKNPDKDKLTLFLAAQKILDRVLFVRFAEARGLLPMNTIAQFVIKGWETVCTELDDDYALYEHLKKYFRHLDTGHTNIQRDIFGFNGGLFRPNATLEGLTVSDEVLRKHLHELCQYNFNSDIDVNILGHIFEHSLTKIEEIKNKLLPPHERIPPKEGIRKKDGVFYTKNYITKYLVEQTLGRLCEDKKQELGINDEWLDAILRAPKKRTKKVLTESHNDERLLPIDEYRSWLLSLTICDPACGSGAFLNATFDFLKAEHRTLDEMVGKIAGISFTSHDIENAILQNNLYGVDINDEGVAITRLALWLHTAKANQKLCFLDKNIKCGNSLIDDASVVSDKAFDWHKEFPQVFAHGGFDVVLGNPPYFNIETLGFRNPQAQWIKERYADIWQKKSDILFYFIYKALEISKSEVGYIVSNALLFSARAAKLRNYLLQDGRLSKIVNFEQFMVFEDASITTGMLIFNGDFSGGACSPLENVNGKRGTSPPAKTIQAIVLKEKDYDIDDIVKIINNEKNIFTVELKENDVFALVPDTIAVLNQKIDGEHIKLEELCRVGSGMQTGTNDVFQFDKLPKKFPRKYIKKRVMGEDVHRYLLANTPDHLLYIDDVKTFEELPIAIQEYLKEHKTELSNRATVINEGRPWWRFSRPVHKKLYHLPKIWCSYRSRDNAFILDETGGDYIGLTNTTVIFGTNPEYSLKYILALLNSKLLSFRYKSLGKQTGGGIFEYFANAVGKLPIPKIDLAAQQPFIDLVDEMLSLHVQLREGRMEFLDVLPDVFAGVKITDTLERFDEYDFKDFLDEFTRQKIDFPAQKIVDWKKVFSKHKKQLSPVHAQISQTDKKIDRLVYELYGLDEPDILIVDPEELLSEK